MLVIRKMTTWIVLSVMCIGHVSSAKERESRSTFTKEPTHALAGIWEQRFIYDGRWQTVLSAELVSRGSRLSMPVLDQRVDGRLINSRGIFNVKHVLEIWTFDSDWGPSGTGNFVLRQQSIDRYTGHAYLDGRDVGINEWVRVAKLVETGRRVGNDDSVNIYESNDELIVTLNGDSGTLEPVGCECLNGKLTLTARRVNRQTAELLKCHWRIAKSQCPPNRIKRIELQVAKN